MTRYKEKLPKDCPPALSIENDDSLILYRIVNTDTLSETEFLPYSRLYPEKEKYKTDCSANGVSFYSDPDIAKKKCLEIYEKGKKLGSFIAKVRFKSKSGKYKCTGQTQHCNFWFYLAANIESDLEYLDLIEVLYEN